MESVPFFDPEFPCSLTIFVPLPTARLATIALRAIEVDKELSPLVHRSFTRSEAILRTEYKATTNRMLRVAVNGFMESVGVVIAAMEDLDVDVFDYDEDQN